MNLAAETLRLSNRFQAREVISYIDSTINKCFTKADYEIKEKDYHHQETIMHERSTTTTIIIDMLKE